MHPSKPSVLKIHVLIHCAQKCAFRWKYKWCGTRSTSQYKKKLAPPAAGKINAFYSTQSVNTCKSIKILCHFTINSNGFGYVCFMLDTFLYYHFFKSKQNIKKTWWNCHITSPIIIACLWCEPERLNKHLSNAIRDLCFGRIEISASCRIAEYLIA